MAGVASEDDDGKQANEAAPPTRQRPAPPKTQPTTAQPVTKPAPTKPVNATPPAEDAPVKPRVIADPVRPVEGGIGAKDRGLLFKIAKTNSYTETQVKQLIFALWGYTSTSQIQQGAQFGKVLSALENPQDHGVSVEDDGTLVYERAADPNALADNADLGGL